MRDEQELIRGNIPTLVLAILSEGPNHAYAIGRSIAERTEHGVKFQRGTLYPVLHLLERDGWVTGKWEHQPGERPRCTYTITEMGRAEFARRVEVWSKFSQAMNKLIGDTAREQPA